MNAMVAERRIPGQWRLVWNSSWLSSISLRRIREGLFFWTRVRGVRFRGKLSGSRQHSRWSLKAPIGWAGRHGQGCSVYFRSGVFRSSRDPAPLRVAQPQAVSLTLIRRPVIIHWVANHRSLGEFTPQTNLKLFQSRTTRHQSILEVTENNAWVVTTIQAERNEIFVFK